MGMCGPFVAFISGSSSPLRSDAHGSFWQKMLRNSLPQGAYHLGRAVTYIGLGALGGSLGAAIDFAGEAAGLVHVAALLSGLLVIFWGLGLLLPRFSFTSPLDRFLGRSLAQLGTKPRVFRASLLGVFTPLLPCGWLYAFVITAAGTGTIQGGALVMVTFWLGTVPALVGMGAVLSRLSAPLRARLPVVTGVALIAIGIFGVMTKMAHPSSSPPAPHDGADAVLSLGDGVRCH